MAARFPLIANSSSNQIQELASGDDLDLTGNSITGAGIITATSFSGNITGNVTGNATGLTGTPDIAVTNITAGIATLTGAISATNGGIGIYPFSVALVLNAFNISNESGLAFGWIMWTSQTLMILVFGSLSFFILPLVNRQK